MAKTTNTTASVASVELVIAKPTIAQIAAMTKAERAAYIAQRTGAQAEDVEIDLSRLTKNVADRAIAGFGRFVGTAKEIAVGAKSSFQAGYLSALDD